MNADEIVMELREHLLCGTSLGMCKIVREEIVAEAADLIDSLQAQLAASQRRADAAVEDLRLSAVELSEGMGTCVVCKHYPDYLGGKCDMCSECVDGECLFEWRGPARERRKQCLDT